MLHFISQIPNCSRLKNFFKHLVLKGGKNLKKPIKIRKKIAAAGEAVAISYFVFPKYYPIIL